MSGELGARMKMYEARYSPTLMPLLPTLARIDGKSFHTYTRNMSRPYDGDLIDLMCKTTAYLVWKTNALIGYTQSDEITLCFYTSNPRSQIYFGGKTQKLISVLASMATAYFNENRPKKWSEFALFDCRVWQVPTLCEAANVFVWREMDAVRNSITLVAQSYYSHKQLLGKNQKELHDMIHARGDNWNEYHAGFKRGSYFKRQPFDHSPWDGEEKFTTAIRRVDMEPILSYPDRVKVLFGVKNTCLEGDSHGE